MCPRQTPLSQQLVLGEAHQPQHVVKIKQLEEHICGTKNGT
jgi:hypothetical protein